MESLHEKRKAKNAMKWLKRSAYFLLFCIVLSSIFTTYEFIETHKFQSPIIIKIKFQNPTPRKFVKIESPLGSKSAGLIQKAYAEEMKNPYSPKSPKGIAWQINKERFGIENWESWEQLGMHEAGWNPFKTNPTSGACGIPQALPCSKMDCEEWDYECQVNWMADYIEDRYNTPNEAWAFWETPHLIEGKMVHYY